MSTRFILSMEMSRLTRDGTAESVSRNQTLRRERGPKNIHFSCFADREQDWQPYLIDPYSCHNVMIIHVQTLVERILSGLPDLSSCDHAEQGHSTHPVSLASTSWTPVANRTHPHNSRSCGHRARRRQDHLHSTEGCLAQDIF